MAATSRSEGSLQGVQFPREGSSGLENGLSNLSWETGTYELYPQGPHPQFQNSGRKSPRRAVEKGDQVREVYLARPDRSYPSGAFSPELPGAEAYRQSLGQVCFQLSPQGWVSGLWWVEASITLCSERRPDDTRRNGRAHRCCPSGARSCPLTDTVLAELWRAETSKTLRSERIPNNACSDRKEGPFFGGPLSCLLWFGITSTKCAYSSNYNIPEVEIYWSNCFLEFCHFHFRWFAFNIIGRLLLHC